MMKMLLPIRKPLPTQWVGSGFRVA